MNHGVARHAGGRVGHVSRICDLRTHANACRPGSAVVLSAFADNKAPTFTITRSLTVDTSTSSLTSSMPIMGRRVGRQSPRGTRSRRSRSPKTTCRGSRGRATKRERTGDGFRVTFADQRVTVTKKSRMIRGVSSTCLGSLKNTWLVSCHSTTREWANVVLNNVTC